MENLNFVLPGYYIEKGAENSDGKNVKLLRVLGESDIREGYWKCDKNVKGGKLTELSEEYILENYDVYKLNYSGGSLNNENLLLNGFEKTEVPENIPTEVPTNIRVYNVESQQVTVNQIQQIPNNQPSFDVQILEKCKSDVGTDLIIPITIKYDLSKIYAIMDLIGIDKNEIVKYLSKVLLDRLSYDGQLEHYVDKALINKQQIKPIYIEPTKIPENNISEIQIKNIYQEAPVVPEKIKKDNFEIIESGIKSIDDVLKNLL